MTQTPSGPTNPYPAQVGNEVPAQQPRKMNTMAILALIFAFVFSPLGIVFGLIGRKQIKRTGEGGRGLATAGLVLGIVFVVVGLATAVLVTIVAVNQPLTVSRAQVAQEISDKAGAQLGAAPDSVVCPEDLPAKVGAVVHCTLTVAGSATPVTATVTSVVGKVANFDIAPG